MRRLPLWPALGFFLCAPAAQLCAAKTPTELARDNVKVNDWKLRDREAVEDRVTRESDTLYNRLSEARNREANASFYDKDYWREEAKKWDKEYKAARKKQEQVRKESNASAKEYLKAEELYKKETGSYLYPDRQDFWTGRVGASYSIPDQAADGSSTGGAGGAPTVAQVMSKAGDIQNVLTQPGTNQERAAGAAVANANQLKDMTRDMLLSTQKAISAGGAAGSSTGDPPPASRQALELDAARMSLKAARSARTAAGGLKVEPDKKILLSPDRAKEPAYDKRRTEPGAGDFRLLDGEEKFRRGDFAGALKDAQDYIREHPDSAKGYILKSKALNKMRRFGEATKAARLALDINPNDSTALRNLAWAQLHTGDYEDALKSANRLLELEPESAHAYLMRAFVYEKLGMRKEMLADLMRAAALDPKYQNHYLKALHGEELFDPGRENSHTLLEAIDYTAPRGINPKVLLGILLLLLALAGTSLPALVQFFGGFLRRRRNGAQAAPGRGHPGADGEKQKKKNPPAVEGAVLGGKYRLERVIGHGGMGKVWRAHDMTLERRVAVKQTLAHLGPRGKVMRELYVKEARTLAGLHHPNIVDIFAIYDRPDGVFLVLEYVSGRTVQDLLSEYRRLTWERASPILLAVSNALCAAHEKGIIHRDLKPANIMVSKRGYIKVMDFGIARFLDEKETPLPSSSNDRAEAPAPVDLRTAHTRTLAGTPAYIPPEAYDGIVSPATDTYALGALLYELLTGETPFGRDGWSEEAARRFIPASRLVERLDPRVDVLIARSLEQEQTRRIATAGEFAGRLRSID